MNRNKLTEFVKDIFKSGEIIKNNLHVSSLSTVDEILTKYFLVIGQKEKVKLDIYVKNHSTQIHKDTLQYVDFVRQKLIDIIASIKRNEPTKKEVTKNYKNSIYYKMESPGRALEYFTLYLLEKNNKTKEIHFDMIPIEMDKIGIDFMTYYKGIQFGIQMTYRKDKQGIKTKKIDLNNIATVLDNENLVKPSFSEKRKVFNENYALNTKNFSEKDIPDIPVLFKINSGATQIFYDHAKAHEGSNMFQNALTEWEKNQFNREGPEAYLNQKIKSDLWLITKTYMRGFHEATEVMKNIETYSQDQYIKKQTKKGLFEVSYCIKENTISVSFYDNKNCNKKFVYSLEFYITNKALGKIGGIKKELQRKMKAPKRIQRKQIS